jgi:RNA polymerase sigma-70 factor, ECF subfamily
MEERLVQYKRAVESPHTDDVAAFEHLFRTYYAELCTYAWRYTRCRDEAEDLVQEVFANVWRLKDRSGSRRNIRHYLFGAVRNRAMNYLEHQALIRDHEVEVQREPSSVAGSADEELHYKELSLLVERVIAELPERRREIFVLHRQHGFTYAAIADLLGISSRTVETQVARALDALRKQIVEYSLDS